MKTNAVVSDKKIIIIYSLSFVSPYHMHGERGGTCKSVSQWSRLPPQPPRPSSPFSQASFCYRGFLCTLVPMWPDYIYEQINVIHELWLIFWLGIKTRIAILFCNIVWVWACTYMHPPVLVRERQHVYAWMCMREDECECMSICSKCVCGYIQFVCMCVGKRECIYKCVHACMRKHECECSSGVWSLSSCHKGLCVLPDQGLITLGDTAITSAFPQKSDDFSWAVTQIQRSKICQNTKQYSVLIWVNSHLIPFLPPLPKLKGKRWRWGGPEDAERHQRGGEEGVHTAFLLQNS